MQSSPQNILQTGAPSQSAQRVAIARAVHQLLDEPLVFDDPLALPILGPDTERLVRDDPFQFNDLGARSMRAAIVARSRLVEDELQRAVRAGVTQYVVLGAGLDTFSLRNPYRDAGLRTYEVDHPATQRSKQAMLRQASISVPESAIFVGVDFEKDALAEKLREAGFRADRPACLSWLGVTVYLEAAAVMQTLAFVAGLPKGSSIVFDYRVRSELLNPMEQMMERFSANMFTAMGEPWKSSFDPAELQRQLGAMGFTDIENLGPEELNARYFARRKDGLQTGGGGFRFVRARV